MLGVQSAPSGETAINSLPTATNFPPPNVRACAAPRQPGRELEESGSIHVIPSWEKSTSAQPKSTLPNATKVPFPKARALPVMPSERGCLDQFTPLDEVRSKPLLPIATKMLLP